MLRSTRSGLPLRRRLPMIFRDDCRRTAILLIALLSCLALDAYGKLPNASASQSPENRECVVLLHGLARTWRSMEKLAEALQAEGYYAVNLDYPSRKKTIERLAVEVIPEGIERCKDVSAKRIHFLTHSMGGIVLRYYLASHEIDRLGRVVMISPPNHGSEVADTLRKNVLYRWFMGPAALELGTDGDSLTEKLGPADYSLGIIAGSHYSFFDAWFASLIPGEDDGKVSVESAKLEGMADFLVVPGTHTFIMANDDVIAQSIHFLRHGHFRRSSDH
jgi:triacylglycerol lipase